MEGDEEAPIPGSPWCQARARIEVPETSDYEWRRQAEYANPIEFARERECPSDASSSTRHPTS